MRTLRPLFLTLLACLAVSPISVIDLPHYASAQLSNVDTAKQDLSQALQAIQMAEQHGASNSDLLPLTNQLNLALQYEETADMFVRQGNTTLSQQYAIQSINISTQVSYEAQSLGNSAQTNALYRTTVYYVLAVAIALVATIAVLETNRIHRALRRRKLLKAHIDYGGERDAS